MRTVSRMQVLQQLRDGHTLLLTRATCQPAPGAEQQGQQLMVRWQEGSHDAAAHDLSAMPALLATPCLQHQVTLGSLCHACGSSALGEQHYRGPLLVRGVIESAMVASCFTHRWVGSAAVARPAN